VESRREADVIVQKLTEHSFADGIFDAKVIGGKLRECCFYIEKYQMAFGQEDTIEICMFGHPFKALVVQIKDAGALQYVHCIVKWK